MLILLFFNIACVLSCPPGPKETSETNTTVASTETSTETTETSVETTEEMSIDGQLEKLIKKKCPLDKIPKESCPSKSEYCKFGSDHTMCKYCGVGPNCPNVCDNQLTRQDKAELLHIHNEFRSRVALGVEKGQPSATNMKKLKWDEKF